MDENPTVVPKNEHWERYHSLCYPCDIDYDYLLKLDTIEEDSDWLFKKFKIENIKYPRGNGAPSNSRKGLNLIFLSKSFLFGLNPF